MSIRIMHVVDTLGTGGTEEGIRKLLAGLDTKAFEQSVCTISGSTDQRSGCGVPVFSLGKSSSGHQFTLGKLHQVFRRQRPHIVHSRNWGAIEAVPAARLARVPVVMHSEHGFELKSYHREPWRRRMGRRACFGLADRVLAVSRGLRDYYATQLGIGHAGLTIIPNGVDTRRYCLRGDLRQATREKLGIQADTILVGTVGRLDPIKDHRTLFDALELLIAEKVRLRLAIVGDGSYRNTLEACVRQRTALGQVTSFVGPTNDVLSYLNAFDVFVLPSVAEGMSNALLEAMAVGVACIATRVGGNPELIEDQASGLLFEVGDSKMLATHLRELLSNNNLRQQLGGNARRRVETEFSLSRMLTDYSQLYEGAVRSSSRSFSKLEDSINLDWLKVGGSNLQGK